MLSFISSLDTMKLWRRASRRISLLFKRRAEVGPKSVCKSSPERGKEVESSGQWYFKKDILDQLDEYFICIRRLRKTDIDGYRLYSRLGATIIPPKTLFEIELGPLWREPARGPSFGAVAILGHNPSDMYNVKFGYFRRLDRVPPNVEPTNGQIYEVTLFYADLNDNGRWGQCSTNFFVSIEKNAIRPLRHVDTQTQTIRHKDVGARRGGPRATRLRHRVWTYGWFLENHKSGDSPEKIARSTFSVIATSYENASKALRVSVTRGGKETAVFTVDLLRTPYFFDDRDVSLTTEGRRRKIFHIVRTHLRQLPNGNTVPVKSHFRGERQFSWNGYDVLISMPAKHHPDLLDLNFGAHIYDDGEDLPSGTIPEIRFIETVAGALQRNATQRKTTP